ncbi:hypothetical protein P9G70_10705 [Bacillus velezensis]|uniref:hypothetical protein n=1 Tax=Bacillus velezensis TaxID=492670 RepID=UPI0013E92380|nr:hypothetical protein [Bacillus velezensis]MEC2167079.1 hypothetical protein [Bacillus velezensis]MED1775344.1 hypothetical protein [Bacillus velezensis]
MLKKLVMISVSRFGDLKNPDLWGIVTVLDNPIWANKERKYEKLLKEWSVP